MVFSSVIDRELRVQARRRSTYFSRLIWGLLAIIFLALLGLYAPQVTLNGSYFLSAIHFWLACMLLIVAPIVTADTLSREMRDGTLGLLLLTRLTARQIVWGKLAAHFFRLACLGLMTLPFLMIPILLGGVGFAEFLRSAAVLTAIMIIGACAGMVASVLFLHFSAVVVAALLFSLGAIWMTAFAAGEGVLAAAGDDRFDIFFRAVVMAPWSVLAPVLMNTGMGGPLPWVSVCQWSNGALVALAAVSPWLTIQFCARRVERFAEHGVETARQALFRRLFLSPILWKHSFRRWLSRRLDRNPFTWLEYRAAWARAARWVSVMILIPVEALLLVKNDPGNYPETQSWVTAALAMMVMLKSSSSFHREKESGAFELLLITPLTERSIVSGRLKAVAGYYRPTLFLLVCLWALQLTSFDISFFHGEELDEALVSICVLGAVFSAAPTGLYFALRHKTLLAALSWTVGLTLLAPILSWFTLDNMLWLIAWGLKSYVAERIRHWLHESWWPVLAPAVLYTLLLIVIAWWASIKLLRRREFAP